MVRHGLLLQQSQFHLGWILAQAADSVARLASGIHVQMETIIDALMQRYRQSSKKLWNGLVHD